MDKERYEANYERMRERSTTGSSGRRKRDQIRMKRSEYIKRIKILMGTTAIATLLAAGITVGAGKTAINHIQDAMTVGQLTNEFRVECINNETHRTQDHQHYYYDYSDIARYIEEMDNFDEGVYYCVSTIGDYQTGQVLAYTDYGSFTNYKEVKGYDSTEEFKDDMKRQILLSEEIKEKEQELQQMQQEHHSIEYERAEERQGGK